MVKSMNEKSRIELLAPAGSWEALEAAVNAGAEYGRQGLWRTPVCQQF